MSSEEDNKEQDAAGPLLGWSLGTGLQRRPIEDLVEFPCVFCFKVVADADPDFLPSLLHRVASVLGRDVAPNEHSVRKSAGGKYESVTLDLRVANADEVYSIYRAISEDSRVRYLLEASGWATRTVPLCVFAHFLAGRG